MNKTVKLMKGYGYYDLTLFAWGGCFRRTTEDTIIKIDRVIDHYKDGSAKKVIGHLPDGTKIGVEL